MKKDQIMSIFENSEFYIIYVLGVELGIEIDHIPRISITFPTSTISIQAQLILSYLHVLKPSQQNFVLLSEVIIVCQIISGR